MTWTKAVDDLVTAADWRDSSFSDHCKSPPLQRSTGS